MNNEREMSEAIAMWQELEGRTKFDEMNELHQIHLDRIQEAHDAEMIERWQRIDFLVGVNSDLTLKHKTMRHRIDYLYLALFACACIIGFLYYEWREAATRMAWTVRP